MKTPRKKILMVRKFKVGTLSYEFATVRDAVDFLKGRNLAELDIYILEPVRVLFSDGDLGKIETQLEQLVAPTP